MFWLANFFTKGKSLKDGIKYFHTINGRMPNNMETIKIKNAFMEQNRGANVVPFPKDRITPFHKPRPGDVKKIDEDPTSAMYDRHIKEIEGIDQGQGIGFYHEMGSILQDVTGKSNVIEFPKDRITPFYKPRPGDVKKTDESPLSTLLGRQSKELEGIDTTKGGMGFYSELGDMMKKHRREKLELDYDDMYNKILDKAKRIETDPKVLLEAELGKKLTGKETTTELLEIFKNRPKKASGGLARILDI